MTQVRKDTLQTGEVYHIYTRSIAKYLIFNDSHEYLRICKLSDCYKFSNFNYKYSNFLELESLRQTEILEKLKAKNELLVDIIAFCVMPTHIHLLLKQQAENGITKYMARVLNGYSRYFNTKHQRIGPLWSGRFKNVLIMDDAQLSHITRYIHLNPASAGLIDKPEEWKYSSYNQYIGNEDLSLLICSYNDLLKVNPEEYKKFVEDQQSYQRDLSLIKYITIDNYAG